jgi:hypothetical protein
MNDDIRHNYPVWDTLFLLLFTCDENVTDEAVDANLKRAGIDMEPAYRRLHNMIEMHRARAQFAAAKETRESIGARIQNIVAPHLGDLRAGIQKLIGNTVSGQEQLAYFHKLEKAASEEDLQSLMDDLEKLAVIRGLRREPETK